MKYLHFKWNCAPPSYITRMFNEYKRRHEESQHALFQTDPIQII